MATYSRKLKDSSGNYIVPVTRSKVVYFDDNSKLSKLTFFPVGAIYQSTGSTSPASLFGGSWEQIQGKFLLGSSSSHSVTSTGGEETHTLTTNEMPVHSHDPNLSDSRFLITDGNGLGRLPALQDLPGGIITVSWDEWTTGRTGGDQPHNNMPPYYTVNIWRRTA